MRVLLALLAFPSLAQATTVCPDGTLDTDGQPLECDFADLDTAIATAAGGPITAYGTFSTGAAITTAATITGAPSDGLTRAVLTDSVSLDCACTVTMEGWAMDNGGSAPLLDVTRGVLTLRDSALTDDFGSTGVAAAAARVAGTLVLEDVHIEGLEGGGTGSPVEVTGGSLTLRRVVSADTRGLNGGLVRATDSTLVVDGAVLMGGAANQGGLLYLSRTTASIYGGSVLRDGVASSSGGLVYADSSQLTLVDSTFADGKATGSNAGAVALLSGTGTSAIQGCTFRSNTAGNGAGALWATNGNLDLSDSVFIANGASNGTSSGGGAIIANTVSGRWERNLFADNLSDNGGALNLGGPGALILADNVFTANTATGAGGAAVLSSELDADLSHNLFLNNQAEQGGALHIDVHLGATTTSDANLFCHNGASVRGGALFVQINDGTAAFGRDVFIENTSPEGGAVSTWFQAVPVFDHVTMLGNGATTAAQSGGSVFSDQSAAVTLTNSIVGFTQAGDGVATGTGTIGIEASAFGSNTPMDWRGGNVTALNTTTNATLGLVAYSLDGDCTNDDWSLDAYSPIAGTDQDGNDPGAGGGAVPMSWADLPEPPGDFDGDGWPDDADCEPLDPTSYPGAEEVCDGGIDNDCDGLADDADLDGVSGQVAGIVDADNDGYHVETGELACPASGGGTLPGDCDDADPLIHPDKTEICDGKDNDCDDLVDGADPSLVGDYTYYQDGDNDFHGDPERPVESCDAVSLLPSVGDDCDDTDPDNYPGNTERCDGNDNDCDDLVDIADPDVQDANTFYVDADNDFHGDPNRPVVTCDEVSILPSVGDDCDDTDPNNYPGNTEVCDGQDNDCDGAIDALDSDVANANVRYTDADADGHADPDSGTPTCDAVTPVVADDCDDADPDNFPGNDEVCDGQDNDCDALVDDADDVVGAPTWLSDGDGDGFAGADGTATRACAPGDGWTQRDGDCDDTAGDVYPGAAETCDERDEDCDDAIDEDAGDAVTWYVDADADGYGDDATAQVSCADLGLARVGGDCAPDDGDIYPGAPETPDDGIDQDCDGVDLTDVDNDGFSAPEDCNDNDNGIHPNATDVPGDGIDQDCSGFDRVSAVGSTCATAPGATWWGLVALPLLARRRQPIRAR